MNSSSSAKTYEKLVNVTKVYPNATAYLGVVIDKFLTSLFAQASAIATISACVSFSTSFCASEEALTVSFWYWVNIFW